MSIITDVLTGGTNNHQTTSEAGNFFATDFVTDGVVGTITNTAGVAPATGAWAVNQNTGSDMNVTIGAGTGYTTATPTGQNSQRLRVRNTATITQAIASNATGGTRYDWIYRAVSATNANNPNAAADNVGSVVVSRSTSNTVDNGTPPTYGTNIAIVTVTNGAVAIVNGNIADTRVQAGAGTSTAGIPDDAVTAAKMQYGMVRSRQGGTTGDATWNTPGTSNTDTSAKAVFIQVGAVTTSSSASTTVTFPIAFTQVPTVIAQDNPHGVQVNSFTIIDAISTTTVGLSAITTGGVRTATDVNWIAIGQ